MHVFCVLRLARKADTPSFAGRHPVRTRCRSAHVLGELKCIAIIESATGGGRRAPKIENFGQGKQVS